MPVIEEFDPDICDLCNSADFSNLIELNTGRAMRSDRRIVEQNLTKRVCTNCGLARSGQPIEAAALEECYLGDYGVSVQPEHYFYTTEGPVSRSRLFCEWMLKSLGTDRISGLRRVLEIGAGSGLLLRELSSRVPGCSFEGLELSPAAVAMAQAAGSQVYSEPLESFAGTDYDLVFAVAVIEHVPSPANFVEQLRLHVRPGGLLLLIQPVQDVWSYDIFFVDHLHHFGSQHLPRYAARCGFEEIFSSIGHRWMPNFSLHLWQRVDGATAGQRGREDFVQTKCGEVASRILEDLRRLNETTEQWRLARSKTAVFGLQEAYWLVNAYSCLRSVDIVCGLDDQPDRPEYRQLGFPVVKPEECRNFGAERVVLTMSPVYYQQAVSRLKRLDFDAYPVFS